jgi:hypothetical protein
MNPQPSDQDRSRLAPPGVRFQWGSFLFDGMVDGIEQSLEFFSPDGKPLRANISLNLSQQKILVTEFKGDGRVPQKPGQKPLGSARAGDSVQSMASRAGKSDWQSIAAANAIDDPLRLSAGALIDLNAGVSISGGISLGAGLSTGVQASANIGFS